MKTFIARTTSDLNSIASEIVQSFGSMKIICFEGEMGSGKTTLIKEICKVLNVEDSTNSPTFSIINEYHSLGGHPIYHFDFYRIRNLREALDVGVEEYFYSGNLCLIEWPEIIEELIPEQHLKISIKLVGNNERLITLGSHTH